VTETAKPSSAEEDCKTKHESADLQPLPKVQNPSQPIQDVGPVADSALESQQVEAECEEDSNGEICLFDSAYDQPGRFA
jgi:hypothetical protein